MTKPILTHLIIATCCVCLARGQEKTSPLVQVKVQSFDALTRGAKQVATALGLAADWDSESQLAAVMGSPQLTGLDRTRPWQLSLAISGFGTPPLVALYLPVTNFEAFKDGLQDTSPLRKAGEKNALIKIDNFAVVVFSQSQAGDASSDQKQTLSAWVPKQGAGAHLIELGLQPNESARQQALQLLGFGRLGLTQALSSQKMPAGAPFNPQALADMMGVYLDGLETLVKGLQRLEVQVDLNDQTFTLNQGITALPDSELAGWLKSDGLGISDLANYLDPKSSFSMAAAIGPKPAYMPILKKLTRAGFQMQNQQLDEKLSNQIDRMLDVLAPMRFAGWGDFGKGFTFSGVYEFPAAGATEAYGAFKQFFKEVMPALAGTGKAYSTVEFKEGVRKVGALSIDRFTMAFNLDSPMFQMPGQRELIERMWAGGKMEAEYAVKGNRLYLASPEKMTELLGAAPPPQSVAALRATRNTALLGRANLPALLKQMMVLNPMLPASLREKAERLPTEGGDVRFRVDLDGRLMGRTEIPLSVLQSLRSLRDSER